MAGLPAISNNAIAERCVQVQAALTRSFVSERLEDCLPLVTGQLPTSLLSDWQKTR